MSEHIDVKVKSWGNGSSSGPWIKLDLADEEALEKLKSQVGNGFHMVLVPIDHGEPQKEVEDVDTVIEQPKKKGMKLSNEAYLMIKEDSFGRYLYARTGQQFNVSQRDDWLKEQCCIDSKKELDISDNKPQMDAFFSIQSYWRSFLNGTQRGLKKDM